MEILCTAIVKLSFRTASYIRDHKRILYDTLSALYARFASTFQNKCENLKIEIYQ